MHVVMSLRHLRARWMIFDTYLRDSDETSSVSDSHEFNCVNRRDSPDYLRIDEAAVDHRLGRAIGSINQILFTQSWAILCVVIIKVEHVENVVNAAADHEICRFWLLAEFDSCDIFIMTLDEAPYRLV